jgi:hypothetical protein
MILCRAAVLALSLLAAACGNGAGNEDGDNDIPPNNAFSRIVPEPSAANLTAAAGCPFEGRNWQARAARISDGGGGGLDLDISGDVRTTGPAAPIVEQRANPTPPEIGFDLKPGDFPAGAGPTNAGTMVSPYNPAFTTAVVYCAGREIARVPIRVER